MVVAGIAIHRSRIESERRRLDLGQFVLQLEPFGWNSDTQQPVPIDPAKVSAGWELHTWKSDDVYGGLVPEDDVVHGAPQIQGRALVEHVEAHGGRAS